MSLTIEQTGNFQPTSRVSQDVIPLVKQGTASGIHFSQLDLPDIGPALADFTSQSERPQLTAPVFYPQQAEVLAQLKKLEEPENAERLDDLRIALTTTPNDINQALHVVLQRELGNSTNAGSRARVEAVQMDEVEQRNVVQAAQAMLVGSLLKESNTQQAAEPSVKNKTDSADAAKQEPFVGIQTNEMMRFLLSVLRQVMAEIYISERRINTMFAELSASMAEKSAASSVREGKEIYKGALMSFATTMLITGVGVAFQSRGLYKQNKAVQTSLKSVNNNGKHSNGLKLTQHQTGESAKGTGFHIGADGQPVAPVNTPPSAQQAQHQLQQQRPVMDTMENTDLHRLRYEQKVNKYRTHNSIAEQLTRNGDSAGQLANASNMTAVKGAEADKTLQSTASDITRSVAKDKEDQVCKSEETIKKMRSNINEMQEMTNKTKQSLIRG